MRPAKDFVPIEELDRNILDLCTRINIATYELLVLIRQFDGRAGFLKWGLQGRAEWLAYRCDLSMRTARENGPVRGRLEFRTETTGIPAERLSDLTLRVPARQPQQSRAVCPRRL